MLVGHIGLNIATNGVVWPILVNNISGVEHFPVSRRSFVDNGVARIFGGGGGNFPWSPEADQIRWGGGVVAEIFRGRRKPADSVGGGG